jgi:predicted ribosome quality control (RQC) complex YloA/Tae2 family protein
VYLYRDGDGAVQPHVIPLRQFKDLTEARAPSLMPLLLEARNDDAALRGARAADATRTALRSRIERRRAALDTERERLDAERQDSADADALRIQGDLLYAHHAEIPPGATSFVAPEQPDITIALAPELDAKANAAAIFRRYRKAVARREHVERRSARNASEIEAAEELGWQVDRAESAALDELQDDVDRLARKPVARKGERGQPRRTALEVPLGLDARVLVGRSPRDNADLTFRVARPDDLWFHARGVPGAHVVLRIDSSRQPTSAELQSAAELAAYHSKARTAGTVPVDYTARKYVRKQQNALPGLVWYTNAKTIDVTPRAGQRT